MTCEICGGSGFTENPPEPPHPPTLNRCSCMLKRDIIRNLENGLRGLSSVPSSRSSNLRGLEKKDLLITSGQEFLSHLKHVVANMPTTWAFKVASDAELVTAWLGSIGLQGKDILDPDAYMVSTQYVTIPDLVVPPDLLIIRMGVKVARNQAASEVLAEAVNTRFHEHRPTWIWEEPSYPLNPGHMFWSDKLGWTLSQHFERVSGLRIPDPITGTKPSSVKILQPSSGNSSKKSLRGGK